jgi:hypothetical protein
MPIVNDFKGPRECVEVISPVEVDHHAAHPVSPLHQRWANAWMVTPARTGRDPFSGEPFQEPINGD